MQYQFTRKFFLYSVKLLNIMGFIFVINLINYNNIQSAEVKAEVSNTPLKIYYLNKPLDFEIGTHHVFTDRENQKFGIFLGANQEVKGNDYAISLATRGVEQLLPLTPSLASINFQANENNPLHGAKIALLSSISILPVVVKSGEDKQVYVFNEGGGLLRSEILNDALNKPTSKIIKMCTADNGVLPGSAIFAAVKNNKDQLFGAPGSGISLLTIQDTVEPSENKTPENNAPSTIKRKLKAFNADPADKITKENKAAPFNGAIKALKINHAAQVVSDVIDMYWDHHLARLYVAVQVKSNSQFNSGAKAVVVGRLLNDKIYFKSIVSDAAITNNNHIVATGMPNDNVSILKVRTMHTSTQLSYLITLGGNGLSTQVGNMLYALPLVDNKREIKNDKRHQKINSLLENSQGTLAKYDQEPMQYYKNDFYQDRAFLKQANSSFDLLTKNDAAAIIGNGPAPLEADKIISDITVVGDSVFISISDDNTQAKHGVFYSQPIFDNKGRIVAWTNWQRYAINKNVYGIGYDNVVAQLWYLTSSESNKVNSLNLTEWQSNDKNVLQKTINSAFKINGGVQGLFDFSTVNSNLKNISLLLATSHKQIALIETNKTKLESLSSEGSKSVLDDSIGLCNNDNIIVMQGKVLDDLNNIVAGAIVNNDNNNWLVVAGSNGIAILADENGNGFSENIQNINSISCGKSFKLIDNFKLVKKLQSVGKFLYVLTDKSFDRIEISQLSINNNKFDILNLAKIDNKLFEQHVNFSDFIVKDKLGLLATTNGLFRTGNNVDILRISNESNINWTQVNVPGSVGPILKLNMIGNNNIFQLYVLSGYIGYYESKINRLYIDLSNNVNEQTIIPINDQFIKNQITSFYDFENFKDGILQIGATLFNFNSKNKDFNDESKDSKDFSIKANLKSTPFLHTASRALTTNSYHVALGMHKFNQIYGMLQDSVDGNLIVNGDFGIIINQ